MDKQFFLSPSERCPITVLEDISLVRLPLDKHTPLKAVKKRARVAAGALLAEHPDPYTGDLHAPFDGVIKDVTPGYIEIAREAPASPAEEAGEEAPKKAKAGDAAGELEKPVAPVSFETGDAAELAGILKRLGVTTKPLLADCELVIINAINPEPGMLYTEALLEEYWDTLDAGLTLLRRLTPASRFIMALPSGNTAVLYGVRNCHLTPNYPVSLTRPLIKAVTGTEKGDGVAVVRLHSLFQLGLAARAGLPLTRTVTSAFGGNYLVPLGTPVEALLGKAGISPQAGDTIVLGGLMRGMAVAGPSRGVSKTDDAVQLIKKGSRPGFADNPCINCGYCVEVCPMRLRPNMLSRCSEFGQYEGCRKENLEDCIECGLCGFVCPSCRPMQQYMRMAKLNLGLHTLQQVGR